MSTPGERPRKRWRGTCVALRFASSAPRRSLGCFGGPAQRLRTAGASCDSSSTSRVSATQRLERLELLEEQRRTRGPGRRRRCGCGRPRRSPAPSITVFSAAGVGLDRAGRAVGVGGDVGGPLAALALVVGHLLRPLAADALGDARPHRLRVAEPPHADVDESRCRTRPAPCPQVSSASRRRPSPSSAGGRARSARRSPRVGGAEPVRRDDRGRPRSRRPARSATSTTPIRSSSGMVLMTAASRPLISGPRIFFACSGRADGPDEPVGGGGVGDLPGHERIDGERLVDGAVRRGRG